MTSLMMSQQLYDEARKFAAISETPADHITVEQVRGCIFIILFIIYNTPPQFYLVNLQHFSCKHAFSIRVENNVNPGSEVIKLFPCSTQLSTKFILLINVKMPTIVGILTFFSMINTTSESLKA